MSYFYISDTHFDHENCIKFDGEENLFPTVEDKNETIISNWNKVVKPNDTVFILGDMVWGRSSNWEKFLPRLTGKKVLIKGNHDKIDDTNSKFFTNIVEYLEVSDCGCKVIMCHYPILFYRQNYKINNYMLYGHVHNTHEYYEMLEYIKQIKLNCDADNKNKGQIINVGSMMPYVNHTPQRLETFIKENQRINDEVTRMILRERRERTRP